MKDLTAGFLKAEIIKSAPYVNLDGLDMRIGYADWICGLDMRIGYAAGVAAQSKI